MSNRLFGRMARKWWLMLVLGIVIGLGVGLPLGRTLPSEKLAGGKLMPENLGGTTPANPNPPDPMIIYRAFPKTFGDQLGFGKGDDGYFVGELVLFPWNRSTIGFLKSNGSVLTIDRYMTLFSLLSSTYGGDGKTTFAVPDLTRESPVSGLTYHIATDGLYPHLRDGDDAVAGDGIKYFAFEDDGLYGAMGEVVLGKNLRERYLPADGRELDRNKHPALFFLMGTAFGGNGQTTFKLPDLSGVKSPIDGVKYYIRVQGLFPSFD